MIVSPRFRLPVLLAIGAAINCTPVPASAINADDTADAGKKTPAQWISQLGADHLAERDAASAALLALGAHAREAVRAALDSSDAEVKARTRELWKTLRWDVIPGADREIADFLDKLDGYKKPGSAQNDYIDPGEYAAWEQFVKKHGAQSLLLIAEFRSAGRPVRDYKAGLEMLLINTPPREVAGIITHARNARESAALESLFDTLAPEETREEAEAGMTGLRVALNELDRAFDWGVAAGSSVGGEHNAPLDAACATAIERGGLFDKMETRALRETAAETDVDKSCTKLSFYIELMAALHKQEHIRKLCDSAGGVDFAKADTNHLPRLVASLEDAGLPSLAVKLLHNARDPYPLYMRSHASAAMKDTKSGDEDWRQAQAAADAIADAAAKKQAWFDIADQMNEWGDPRAETLFRKILATPPEDRYLDGNASLDLAQLLEEKKEYAEAAGLYQRGFDISGGAMIVSVQGSGENIEPKDWIRDKVKELREKAATAKGGPGPAQQKANDSPRLKTDNPTVP